MHPQGRVVVSDVRYLVDPSFDAIDAYLVPFGHIDGPELDPEGLVLVVEASALEDARSDVVREFSYCGELGAVLRDGMLWFGQIDFISKSQCKMHSLPNA